MLRYLLVLLTVPMMASATEWNIRPWDEEMDRDRVVERVVGQSVLFMDGGVASYGATGQYSYTYKGGRAFTGKYEITDEGAICIAFDNGPTRCDLYVLHGERLVMIAETGRRFPVAVGAAKDP